MEGIACACILRAKLHELGPIRDQLACLSAKIDSIVGMHVWGLKSLEKAGNVVLMTVGCKPLTGPKQSALSPVGDEGTTYIYTH